jgi:glutaminase
MSFSTSLKSSSPILDYVQELHKTYTSLMEGTVASYIPELAKADPNWFGIALVTASGAVYETGDSRHAFTIQSISKPFVYGLALEDNTRAEVQARVGVEPTGDAFNAISLEPGTGRPRNPMINAGAIAAAGLIAGKSHATRLSRMLQMFSLCAGRELAIDETVYRSEAETGHRNRAIGHMLRNFDILREPPDPVVDLYFKQCSISVTCLDLAVMAATLANRGINPLTGKQAIRGEYVESVLSVMASCGMYDYAGEWLYRIGMPAKSGVSGGVIAVLPGQLGVGVFSPPLDARGNSVRGLRVCNDLSRSFDLHLFNNPNADRSVIRLEFTGAEVNSTRVRTADEARNLQNSGSAIRVLQLQGNLVFSTCEVVVRRVFSILHETDFVLLDLKHVLGTDECAARLLYQLWAKMRAMGKTLLFCALSRAPGLRRYLKIKLGEQFQREFRLFDDSDPALEWCENRLLESRFTLRGSVFAPLTAGYELFRNLNEEEIRAVAGLFERRCYKAGTVLARIGDPSSEVFFIASGLANVTVPVASGTQKRLGAFSAGMALGEMGFLDRAPRSAEITAETDIECDILKLDEFEPLAITQPRIKIILFTNMALGIADRLRKATRAMRVFD